MRRGSLRIWALCLVGCAPLAPGQARSFRPADSGLVEANEAFGDPHGGRFPYAKAVEGLPDTGLLRATLVTDEGNIECTLEPGNAPIAVGRRHEIRSGDAVQIGPFTLVVLGQRALTRTSHEFVVKSAAMRSLYEMIDRVAVGSISVLILGETGVGKEVTAEAIHLRSRRSHAPFIRLNCAALTESLIESELFGHEKGAFTGATDAKPGLIETAHGGTLFLDEVGELPMSTQAKLLRFLEDREVRRVGALEGKRVDVRLVAATNRDLQADVEAGRFRRDLYARLSLLETRLPPLRERRGDILEWIGILHRRWASSRDYASDAALEFSSDAVEALLVHPWNENLRGLDRLVHELGPAGERVTKAALPKWLTARDASPPAAAQPTPVKGVKRPSKDALVAALEAAQWNIASVASAYGKDRKQIYRWIEALGIELPR